MDLEETETRNDYAGKSQQKSDRQTYSQSGPGGQELPSLGICVRVTSQGGLGPRNLHWCGSHYQATTSEDAAD
jgi:hypothetical protein